MITAETLWRRAAILCGAILFVGTIAVSASSPADKPADALLPAPNCSNGWIMEGKVASYTRDNLYDYIDGEAELYLAYGFEFLVTTAYSKKGDQKDTIVINIFRMGSLLDAFGIYAYYRRPDAEMVPIGGDGFVTESHLMFYQDRYFIQLSASGTSSLDRAVLNECADSVARNLPQQLVPPKELELIRIPALAPRTERYIAHSILGYAFFRRGVIGDAAGNAARARIFVVLEDSPETAGRALKQYVGYLKDSGVEPRWDHETLMAADPLYKSMVLQQSGRYILGVVGFTDASMSALVLQQLKTRVVR